MKNKHFPKVMILCEQQLAKNPFLPYNAAFNTRSRPENTVRKIIFTGKNKIVIGMDMKMIMMSHAEPAIRLPVLL